MKKRKKGGCEEKSGGCIYQFPFNNISANSFKFN